MISHEVLSTGSKGNAVIIGKSVLIDCGVPYRMIEPHIRELKLVLLTHIHSDHFTPSTIRRMAMERPLLRFGGCSWMIKPLVEAGVPRRQIDVLTTGTMYGYGICNVIPFSLVHDVLNCGYKLHFPGGKAIYATDTNSLAGITAHHYDLYLLECNYEDEEIRRKIEEKKAAGEYAYEMRVLRTHLSKAKCDDFIARNIGPTGRYVYLHGHVDKEEVNNNERPAEGDDTGP